MKNVLLLSFGLLGSGVGVAQSNFRPGYVVPLQGDTLRGEVDYRGALRNGRECSFRPNGSTTAVEYQPAQLRGYGLKQGRIYEVQTVKTPDGTPAPYFLEVLEQGKVTLYYLRDAAEKDVFYAAREGQAPQLLERKVEKVLLDAGTVTERMVLQERSLYRNTLAGLFDNCADVRGRLERLAYGENPLRQIVRRYNVCVGGPSTQTVPTAKSRLSFGLAVGAKVNRFVVTSSAASQQGQEYTSSPAVGITFGGRMNQRNDKLSVQGALLHEHLKFTKSLYYTSFSSSRREISFEASYLRLPVLLRYTFGTKTLRPFCELGVTNAYAYKFKSEERDVYFGGQGPVKPIENAQRRYEQAWIAGIGVKTEWTDKRNMTFSVLMERGNGFSESTGFGTRIRRVYGLLSYDLTK